MLGSTRHQSFPAEVARQGRLDPAAAVFEPGDRPDPIRDLGRGVGGKENLKARTRVRADHEFTISEPRANGKNGT
jgi:hypothetical protein